MNKGLLMSAAGNLYLSFFVGLLIVVLFLAWAIALLRTLTGGKENTNLQKMYGQEHEKVADVEKKKKMALLAVSGICLAGLAVLYYILL